MRRLLLVSAIVAIAGAALAKDPAPGFLSPEALPDTAAILPPAPIAGTDRYAMDRAVFKTSRSLEGAPRWSLAQNDDAINADAMLKDFACAANLTLTRETAPVLASLIDRAGRDAGATTSRAKAIFKRQRPFLIDEGAICIPRSDDLAASYDYPSGHTTYGWTIGLILAELFPDRAQPILIRARAYGESRVVCGVHNASAIEAGRTNGAAVTAALHGSAEFRAAMEAARAEIAAAKVSRPDPATCATEAALIARTPYPQ